MMCFNVMLYAWFIPMPNTTTLCKPEIALAPFQDDNFDTDKTQGFIGTALTGSLPRLLTRIDGTLGVGIGDAFDNIGEVLSLYDKDELDKLEEPGSTGSFIVPSAGEEGLQGGGKR
jgi:hypothetical protein